MAFSISKLLFDLWCTISLVGIWPRFIEPNLFHKKKLKITLKTLPKGFETLKIIQFSDLHFGKNTSCNFLKRLSSKILKEKADLIVFTGDFLCFSQLPNKEILKEFLNSLKAPLGSFAVLGNHDYERFVSINEKGEYDVIEKVSPALLKGFKRLFSNIKLKHTTTEKAKKVSCHQELDNLLKETPFQLLHNSQATVKIEDTFLNIVGLGEYCLGKCEPEKAFQNLNANCPTLVLAHNPDSISLLKNYPGDLILCGHTHGGQINLPFLRKKFTLSENQGLIRGLKAVDNKKIYINKGVGSVMKFRWFSMPEILSLTFKGEENETS
ncbi:MAG TPA: UDP-2,3-diacylglucosamine diphosphatase LpxG [Parachlamydiaceae bacterium]|nr:UDP-2,3-diacylglucosamine diphosphatase LpxG [Parachlamydiaceae bacterium]